MDPTDLPAASGVYAIKSGERWLYIGRSQNIAQRLQFPWHPARITLGLETLQLSYHWHPHPVEGLGQLEHALIRQHAPEWNGGTSLWGYGATHGPVCNLPPPPLTAEEREQVERARGLLFSA